MSEIAEKNAPVYSVGTLKYTLPKLLLVCSMMLLATQTLSLVCYNLVPGVKPIMLDRAGADATDIALIIGIMPQIVSFFLCPIISTWSDKTRTRIGRRQPFLILSAPFLVLSLVLMAWAPEIAAILQKIFPILQGTNTVLGVLAVLIIAFQILYMFPGSVVYYLIADVVPKACIGRYMAVTTVCGSALGAGFNFFILKPAVEHLKPTFCIIGALYMLIYLLLLCFVKEGEYPPVEDQIDHDKNVMARSRDYVWMFFRQCFQHRIFILLFVCTGLNNASNICRNMYNVLFATKDIGMDIGMYGKIIGMGSVISAFVVLILGKIMDKTHPMMIYLIGGIFIMIVNVFGYFFVHSTATFAVIGIATTLMYAAQSLAQEPLLIDLLPCDKYGQFASANSMVNAIVVLIGAWLGGHCTEFFGYRVMFVWDLVVTFFATLALLGVYKDWKHFGGKDNYHSPEIR